ncbi:MAG TPA: branched-chain amino acid ABC transporter permease [Nitrososphaerales archaeon]|nr:branched-chain amino acid ABC transporter permease [Nitrososphaerales archaeon]
MGLPPVILFGINFVPFIIDFIEFYALYLAISLSLNLEFGYTGVPNFGKVLFIAGGAAFGGILSGFLAVQITGIGRGQDYIALSGRIVNQIDLNIAQNPALAVELMAFALVIAALIGGVLGFLASYPAIRLREDYLGMLLLAMAQFFDVALRTYSSVPIAIPDPAYYFSTLGPGVEGLVDDAIIVGFLVAVYLFIERVVRSPMGRTLRAVRDNENASAALGKDNTKVRRNVLIVASAIAAMAGALYSFYVGSFEYDTWTRFAWTFWPFLIVIIGGAGNNTGVALGTFFFSAIFKGLQQEQQALQKYVSFSPGFVNWVQDLIFAGMLLAILYLRPEGIIREKSSFTLPRKVLNRIAKNKGSGQASQTSEKEGVIGRLIGRLRRGGGGEDRSADVKAAQS